jgi:hypothetical protein
MPVDYKTVYKVSIPFKHQRTSLNCTKDTHRKGNFLSIKIFLCFLKLFKLLFVYI